MLYQITATRHETREDGWESTKQLPTFYLDSRVQGILNSQHAERVALDLLETAASNPNVRWTVSAWALS